MEPLRSGPPNLSACPRPCQPHLPYVIEHIDELAPHCGALLKHIDDVLLYGDEDEIYLPELLP